MFRIQTLVSNEVYDEAEAEDIGGTMLAVDTLLKESAYYAQVRVAVVTNMETGEVVWRGKSIATRL